MHHFEQEFYEGQMLDEFYMVTHHTPEKPLYQRIYEGFEPGEIPWGGVQVRDIRDDWCGWQRIWPIRSKDEDLG
jgi:hypothetical protein